MTSDLRILAENRDAILLAEVGAWLHMLGKYDYEFVKNAKNYNYKEFYKNLDDSNPLKIILKDKWPQKIWKINKINELKNAPIDFSQFMAKHTDHGIGVNLLRILVDSHGRGSGIEKSILNKNSYDNQSELEYYKKVHISTAFGYEISIDQNTLNNKKDLIYRFVVEQLGDLKKRLNQNSSCSSEEWWKWRQPFIERFKKDYSITVGDTRRPINDITLWDQTVVTVAFFKAELAEILLNGWKDPLDKNNKFKYRILHVVFDAENFIAQSSRAGDILSRKKLIENSFNDIKYLIEVEYPLGLEIYRDTNSIVFLAPDVSDLLELQNNENKTLRQLIEERFYNIFSGEVTPDILLSPNGSRNVFFIGKELAKPVKPPSPTLSFLKESWGVVEDKCSICQVRPQGYGAELINAYKNNANYYKNKAQKRKMCCICMERLQGRSEDWAKNLDKTIWIDEVADTNGRVALIAGRFDLDRWKNGELISTFRNLKDNCGTTFGELDKEFNANQNKNLKNLTKFMMIVDEKNVVENLNPPTIGGLNAFLIQDEDLNENEFSSIPPNEKLALAVWRKPPSFARLRRVWETTQDFWENTIIGMLNKEKIVGTIGPRLVITGNVDNKVGDYHAYNVELKKGVETCFVYDKNNNRYINVCNLRYLAKRLARNDDKKDLTNEEAAQKVKDYIDKKGTLDLYEDLAQNGKPVKVATIRECKATPELHNYLPAIPILVDPEKFMVLVPAEKALNVANLIRTEYEVQFSKVKNRLPLHLNIIFFDRKQPLYAALDAARRMLSRRSRHDTLWEIKSINEMDEKEKSAHLDERLASRCKRIVLKRIDNSTLNQECEVLVSYGLGDPNKKDLWHPYFFTKTKAPGEEEFNKRNYHFRAPFRRKDEDDKDEDDYEMKDLVHVSDLKVGDIIYYTPSTFDFQFLDVTTRRYELVYKDEMRLGPSESWITRSFLLEDLAVMTRLWELLSKLKLSQIQQLAGLIEEWHKRWQIIDYKDYTYVAFAKYALIRACGKQWHKLSEKDQNDLINWAVCGRLFDLLELYLKILKQKPKGDIPTMKVQT